MMLRLWSVLLYCKSRIRVRRRTTLRVFSTSPQASWFFSSASSSAGQCCITRFYPFASFSSQFSALDSLLRLLLLYWSISSL